MFIITARFMQPMQGTMRVQSRTRLLGLCPPFGADCFWIFSISHPEPYIRRLLAGHELLLLASLPLRHGGVGDGDCVRDDHLLQGRKVEVLGRTAGEHDTRERHTGSAQSTRSCVQSSPFISSPLKKGIPKQLLRHVSALSIIEITDKLSKDLGKRSRPRVKITKVITMQHSRTSMCSSSAAPVMSVSRMAIS